MRIVVITRSPGRGGAGGYAQRLAKGLETRGHQVRIWTSSSGPLRFAWEARHAARGEIPIAIERTFGHAIYRAGGGVHRVYRAALGKRWSRLDWLDQVAVDRARVVVANSHAVARDLIRELGVPASKIEIVRTGVDAQRFRPSFHEHPGRVVLFAAHGWRRKGFEVAVQSFAAIAGAQDQLWVAGRDGRRARWMRWARKRVPTLKDLGEAVDTAAILPRVDAVLHPTRYDPASNLVLEAMACGVPPITTQMDGSAEVVPEPRLVVEQAVDVRQVSSALRFALDARGALTGALRASALDWPDTRNAKAMEAIVSRCGNG